MKREGLLVALSATLASIGVGLLIGATFALLMQWRPPQSSALMLAGAFGFCLLWPLMLSLVVRAGRSWRGR